MSLGLEDDIVAIAEQENQKFENRFKPGSLAPLKRTPGNEVIDSPDIYRIEGNRREDDSIIIVSNGLFPDFVSEAVEKAEAAATALEPRLNKPVLRPSVTGSYGKQSYAFWPRHLAISDNRILKRLQIQSVYQGAYQWLCEVARTTRVVVEPGEELTNQYIEPLTFLVDQDFVPDDTKRIASATLESLEAARFRPVSVLQHGDFWYGNLLLERSWPFPLRSPMPFYVIDWGGANLRGYPYIDQLRYLMSVGKKNSALAHYLNRYSTSCGLSTNDIVSYACSYAGQLGMNRNEFPQDRYIQLISTLLSKATGLAGGLSPKPA